jgi:D-glycero-D-manno-heptose 1,7-bisphosphate phosphatase
MNKAVFLDKDGTLIIDVPYNVDPSLIKLEKGVGPALRLLKQAGYLLIVISNQSGVAHGYFREEDLALVSERLQAELKNENVSFDGFFYCPHHPEGKIVQYAISCDCRKPQAGMILRAAEQFNIDLNSSWMVGDILNDIEAGNMAGCSTILINNGNETEWLLNDQRKPTCVFDCITDAVSYILQRQAA